jgi:hypothetical protein
MVDNEKMHTDTINTKNNIEPWRLHKIKLNSAKSIVYNKEVHNKHWYHLQDFTGSYSNKKTTLVSEDNLVQGEPVDRNFQYQFLATTAGDALIHLTIAIFTRRLHISNQGLMWI